MTSAAIKAAMIRAFQWDLARQVERLDWLLAQLPRYADWGYNELYLHLEDAVEYPSLPDVARPDAYSYRQMTKLVNAASRVGINVVPIVNLLGHTQYLVKVPALRDLNELRAPDGTPLERGQICPVHPRTLEIADKLLRDMAPFCTAGKVHVGLDESFHLGKHPLSRKEISRIGLPAHFARYVGHLRELTRAHGHQMGIWADMLYFLPGAIPLLPKDIAAYEWYYYAFSRRPRVELFNFAESDVGERLRAHGLEYWGCPMNGAFRFEPLPHFTDRLENIVAWWRRCRRLDAAGFLVTAWEPNRLAMELTTVVDAAAASLWLDGETLDHRQMLERGFARVFGRSGAKRAARTALACDRYPFSGYPRWEINSRWDVVSQRESIAPYRREERHFRALATKGKSAGRALPKPLQASVELRWYLAARDVWVRETQRNEILGAHADDARSSAERSARGRTKTGAAVTSGFSQAHHLGLRAARTMWSTTRDSRTHGPNEDILLADKARWQAWRKGEPVFGPSWQLCYRVNNVAPAAQMIVVEQQTSDGAWTTLQGCHTIEFQTRGAKPRGGLRREHAAPVIWDGNRQEMPRLRFGLRGAGWVTIEAVYLTKGAIVLHAAVRRLKLGRAAPRKGFLALDWTVNQVTAPIAF